MKKHLVIITDKENKKLQEIKKELRLANVNLTFKRLINEFKIKER